MRPHRFLIGIGVMLVTTTAVVAGHDVLVWSLFRSFSEMGLPQPARFASPAAGLAIHLLVGVWILPMLWLTARLGVRRETIWAALATAIAAIDLRAMTEASCGVLVQDLPVYLMSAVAVAVPVAMTARGRWARPLRVRAWRAAASGAPRSRRVAA